MNSSGPVSTEVTMTSFSSHVRNQFYQYDSGIYRHLTSHMILNRLADRLREVATDYSQYPGLVWLTGNRHLGGVIAHLKGQTEKEEAFKNEQGLIHVANGVLDLNGGSVVLKPFSPNLISCNLIPISYDPKAKYSQFRNKLLGLLEKEDQDLLQKFLGLFLLGRNVIQKLLILHGLGETGKSTFTEVARKLIGPENCSELRTNLLHERFEIGSFVGKHLLIGADVASSFLNSDGAFRLKAIVGGDLLEAERKNTNYRFQLPGAFNVVVTSNTRLTLRLEGDRGAWRRRLAIIEYEKPRTSKMIPEFAHLLICQEGSGILNFAVEGLLNLWSDIKDHGTIELSSKQAERVNSLLDESDGLRLFLTDSLEVAPGYDLASREIVSEFAKFCIGRGWNMNPRQVELRLENLMLELFGVLKSNDIKRGPPNKQTNVRGFHGVKFHP
jgi:putative DNA primase/helicase